MTCSGLFGNSRLTHFSASAAKCDACFSVSDWLLFIWAWVVIVKHRTLKQTKKAFIVLRLSNGEMVYQCECVVQLPFPELRSEMLNKEFRSSASSRAGRGLPLRRDKVECPWRCDGPIASARESLPVRRRRWEVVF